MAARGDCDCHARLEMQDPDLAWVNVSTGLDTPDWFNSSQIRDSIDANTMSFAAELLRDTVSLSLAPLLESSPLNRNAAAAYAPFLDLVRMWRKSAAVVEHGQTPSTARTNVVLWNRDLTNAAWTKTNITATMDVAGVDGVPNSATRLQSTAANGTCLQAITLGSSARFQSAYVKRLSGTSVIQMTMDNGATWTTVTLTTSWTRVSIPTQTLANPTVGFKIVSTLNDIAVDLVQNESGTAATGAIPTTTVAVTVNDWKEIGKGYIDTINVNDSNNASISVTGRGEEAAIIDTEILVRRIYSVADADDMETVIQALLDDNMASPPTLYVPVPTSEGIKEYEQDYGSLMGAIRAVADVAGYVVRYVYDANNVNRLTLFLPPRTATVPDWDIGPDEYLSLPLNRFDISGVRNLVIVRFNNEDTGLPETVQSPVSGTSGSITTFGRRTLSIDLASDTQVTTTARAQGLADAICADLEYPVLEEQFESPGLWFVQLTDYVEMLPNAVTY